MIDEDTSVSAFEIVLEQEANALVASTQIKTAELVQVALNDTSNIEIPPILTPLTDEIQEDTSSSPLQIADATQQPSVSASVVLYQQNTDHDYSLTVAASKKPVRRLSELRPCILSQTQILKMVNMPQFTEVAFGCYARVLDNHIHRHILSRIRDILEAPQLTEFSGIYHKKLLVFEGSAGLPINIACVSDDPVTEFEFHVWYNGLFPMSKQLPIRPSINFVKQKQFQIKEALDEHFSRRQYYLTPRGVPIPIHKTDLCLKDLQRCMINRTRLAQYANAPNFADLVQNSFVRVIICYPAQNKTVYKIGQIIGVADGHNLYRVDGRVQTKKLLRIKFLAQQFPWYNEKFFVWQRPLTAISNSLITGAEFESWFKAAEKAEMLPVLTMSYIAEIYNRLQRRFRTDLKFYEVVDKPQQQKVSLPPTRFISATHVAEKPASEQLQNDTVNEVPSIDRLSPELDDFDEVDPLLRRYEIVPGLCAIDRFDGRAPSEIFKELRRLIENKTAPVEPTAPSSSSSPMGGIHRDSPLDPALVFVALHGLIANSAVCDRCDNKMNLQRHANGQGEGVRWVCSGASNRSRCSSRSVRFGSVFSNVKTKNMPTFLLGILCYCEGLSVLTEDAEGITFPDDGLDMGQLIGKTVKTVCKDVLKRYNYEQSGMIALSLSEEAEVERRFREEVLSRGKSVFAGLVDYIHRYFPIAKVDDDNNVDDNDFDSDAILIEEAQLRASASPSSANDLNNNNPEVVEVGEVVNNGESGRELTSSVVVAEVAQTSSSTLSSGTDPDVAKASQFRFKEETNDQPLAYKPSDFDNTFLLPSTSATSMPASFDFEVPSSSNDVKAEPLLMALSPSKLRALQRKIFVSAEFAGFYTTCSRDPDDDFIDRPDSRPSSPDIATRCTTTKKGGKRRRSKRQPRVASPPPATRKDDAATEELRHNKLAIIFIWKKRLWECQVEDWDDEEEEAEAEGSKDNNVNDFDAVVEEEEMEKSRLCGARRGRSAQKRQHADDAASDASYMPSRPKRQRWRRQQSSVPSTPDSSSGTPISAAPIFNGDDNSGNNDSAPSPSSSDAARTLSAWEVALLKRHGFQPTEINPS